jgi:hypothetical protein
MDLEFHIPVNGRQHKANVLLKEDGHRIFEHKADLADADERRKLAERLASDNLFPDLRRKSPEKRAEEIKRRIDAGYFAAKDQHDREQEAARAAANQPPPEEPDQPDRQEKLRELPEQARREAEALLADPDLLTLVKDDVQALGVAGEGNLIKFQYVVGVSRLLDSPLASRVKGPSSSGKNYVIDKVAGLFPPEVVIRATQITPQALFYMKPGSLRHRWVVAGERSRGEEDEVAEATRALREMISERRISKLVSMKVGGNIETVHIEQEGPIAFTESTTLADVFAEDRNRCVELYTDERPEQTRAIVTRLAMAYGGQLTTAAGAEGIAQKHHALQWLLEPLPVMVPFADKVGGLLETKRVEVPRVFPQLMQTVQALALLHQRQRERDFCGRLLATAADYTNARLLLTGPLNRIVGTGVSEAALRFYERLKARVQQTEFTATDAVRHETVARSAVYGWLRELHEAGLVDQLTPAVGKKPAFWQVSQRSVETTTAWLPTEAAVFG